jgi:hypothetical protein
MPHLPSPIPNNLNLNMMKPINGRFLNENRPGRRLPDSPLNPIIQFILFTHKPYPPPTTPINSLDHDRKSNPSRKITSFIQASSWLRHGF